MTTIAIMRTVDGGCRLSYYENDNRGYFDSQSTYGEGFSECHASSFLREDPTKPPEGIDKLEHVWIDPLRYCPVSKRYWIIPPCYRTFNEVDSLLDYEYDQEWSDVIYFAPQTWARLIEIFRSHIGVPAFYVRRASEHRPSHRTIAAGPWGFDLALGSRGIGKYAKVNPEINVNQCAAFELKRWLYGKNEPLMPSRQIIEYAARRRIVKHRATASDIQFFQTVFGASQVARWVKESQKKHKQ